MVDRRLFGLLCVAALAASPSPAQDVFDGLPEIQELPADSEVRRQVLQRRRFGQAEKEAPAPPAERLRERMSSIAKGAAETKAALGAAPAPNVAVEEPPLLVMPEDVELGKVYLEGKNVRYLGLRVWLVNETAEPITVRRESFRLAARGKELAPGAAPRRPGLLGLQIGPRFVELADLTRQEPVTVPAGGVASATVAFFDLPGQADVPPMTLRLPAGERVVEVDLNDHALGLMRLGIERIGAFGLLAVVTVRGEITPVGVGGLVEVLDKLAATGAARFVLTWDAGAPAVHPDLMNWLVQSATTPAGVPVNDGQRPGLPPALRELHLAAFPDGTGVPNVPGPRRIHATVAEAAVAAIEKAYGTLPEAELLREIESGHRLTRAAAVAEGGRLADEKLPLLLSLTGDQDIAIAKAAVRSLREFGSAEAVGRLVELAKSGRVPVRFSAVESLAASRFAAAHEALRDLLDASAGGPPVVPPAALVPVLAEYPRQLWGGALYRLATTGDAAVRSEALEALAKLGHADLMAAFEQALASDDERLRGAAFRLLARRRDAASEELAIQFTLDRLETEPPGREMYGLLQRTKDPRAVPLLLKHLEAGGPNRSDLIRLLSQVGGLGVRDALEAAYPGLEKTAQAQTLGALAQMHSPKFYDFAAAALRSNDPALINTAAQQLQIDGGPEAVKLLVAMLFESEQPVILSNAANGLATIGTPEARAALRKAARSNEARGRVAGSAWWQLQRQSAGWDSFLAGRAASEQEDWKQAAERYTDAVELDGQFVDAWAGRANANMQLSDYAAAEADYARTLELDPEDAAAVTCLGILRVFAGKVDEGLAFVRERAAGFGKSELFAYNSACLYSVAADRIEKEDAPRAERLRSDAVKELAHSVELGMTTPAEVEWMTKDPDLKGLQDRKDFKKILAEARKLAKETKPEEE